MNPQGTSHRMPKLAEESGYAQLHSKGRYWPHGGGPIRAHHTPGCYCPASLLDLVHFQPRVLGLAPGGGSFHFCTAAQ